MKKLGDMSIAWVGLALLCPAAFAATQEEALATITEVMGYVFAAFVAIVVIGVYFKRSQDKHSDRLSRIFKEGDAVHTVEPETTVTECVRLMTAKKIGALIIMEAGRIRGIFTERDAMNKVLATGLDPAHTAVAAVMTRDPVCIAPGTTVGEAMELITQRRFRHLPIVENGKLLAVVSSGDLTHWLIKDQLGEIQQLFDVAAWS